MDLECETELFESRSRRLAISIRIFTAALPETAESAIARERQREPERGREF